MLLFVFECWSNLHCCHASLASWSKHRNLIFPEWRETYFSPFEKILNWVFLWRTVDTGWNSAMFFVLSDVSTCPTSQDLLIDSCRFLVGQVCCLLVWDVLLVAAAASHRSMLWETSWPLNNLLPVHLSGIRATEFTHTAAPTIRYSERWQSVGSQEEICPLFYRFFIC